LQYSFPISQITSLFNSRTDAFAKRWEKVGKAGYYPVYKYDPYSYRKHKIKGGDFREYAEKELEPLTEEQILKHLQGDQFIGIYPLLKDNTSWFIAADFDEEKWIEQSRKFIETCNANIIPVYVERSRSGKGGHVWIFFDKPYPAIRSRKIIISLLERSGGISIFDKASSFDRLFPNQDTLSGKGFGNLIALPFNRTSMEQGNCCFIDPITLDPYPDQWVFLKNIQRISISKMDEMYGSITLANRTSSIPGSVTIDGKLIIRLNEAARINRHALPVSVINFLKEQLNFANAEFFIKKNSGKNTWNTQRYFKLFEETEHDVIIPRGFAGKLIRFCKAQNIEFEFRDERKRLPLVHFKSSIILRDHQAAALEASSKRDFGVIVAPPGTGKTIIGLKIIAEKQQPALILVHRKQLADQWIERIQSFLGIPRHEIGKIVQGKGHPGKSITVGMIQSLSKIIESNESPELLNSFGTVIVDECHHIPAETYKSVVSKLWSFYLYGLTATPFRKYNDGKLIFVYLGEIISEVKAQEVSGHKKVTIIIRNTNLEVPFNSRIDRFETLSNFLIHDTARNRLILEDVTNELKTGKRVVIITERKEHIETLYQFLKQRYEAITLSGNDTEVSRNNKWKALKEGNYQVLITTGQYFGEGTDLQNAECLFLVYPFSFEGKLIQYIGRVQRSEVAPVIYDYRDYKIDYLNKLFLKRNCYYRKLERQASLFDEEGIEITTNERTFKFEKRIKLSFDQLEFRYGSVAFPQEVPPMHTCLEFEVENNEVRPEFDVLKPYFSKVLKTNLVEISLIAEFDDGKLISQIATSTDLERINREIIDSVRFHFVNRKFFGMNGTSARNLLDLDELHEESGSPVSLYHCAEELLDDILRNKKIRHYHQLRYLAERHDNAILKIRFVLSPFSFVFLLAGEDQYHIIMETLDTKEATYVWHISKSMHDLKQKLKKIDQDLNVIRNEGRQEFLEKQPTDFSRVLHDYSDEKKGFVIWKGLLEERLV
jgi:superfamily II DNA or RNA helicase